MKLKKPNQYLTDQIKNDNFDFKSCKISDSQISIVFHNRVDDRDLRLKINCEKPAFVNEDFLKASKIEDFTVLRVNRYMGYSTMICKSIVLNVNGDSISLEVSNV